jgi:hypothetical protein
MAEKAYVAGVHFIVKALEGQRFPVGKQELIERCGDTVVQIGWTETRTMRELLEPIGVDRFETSASLHCAIIAYLPSLASGC